MIAEIAALICILALVDYGFIKNKNYREVKFFWPVLVALNLVFVFLVLPNLMEFFQK